jgi:hypothetical protein
MSKLTHINANGEAQMVDVSDKNLWPLSNTLLSYFPGVVVEVPEQKNESNK